jgi:DNA-binding MarR family transcriptional regulator
MTKRARSAARTIYLLKAAEVAVRVAADPLLRDFDLTMAQYTALSLIGSRDDLSSADLARRLSVTPQSINELIIRLEQVGLVRRVEDPGNRRILRLSVTDIGRDMLHRCDAVIDTLEQRLLTGFTPSEVERFRQMLDAIATAGREAPV